MNFLAHLHLADPDPGLLLGGIVADFAKPAELATLPPEVQDGVRLHRLIDGFTDSHPIVRGSVAGLRRSSTGSPASSSTFITTTSLPANGAGIRSKRWRASPADRMSPSKHCSPTLGPEGADFIRWMIEDQRLQRYATMEGIEDTLARLSRRIVKRIPKNAVRLEDAMPLLRDNDARLVSDFHAFYPELMAFAARARGEIGRV